ncbi:MAG: HEAT repeat domain-containing protein, partial [Myxococcales bacterium]
MLSKEILTDPGYTPKRHDLGLVLDWFLFEPDDVAKLAERALLNAGAPVAELAITRLDQVPAPPRARLARLIGRLAQRTLQTDTALALIRVLADPEPRVVRTAIVALGKLPSDLAHTIGAARALSDRLPEFAEPERRAAIVALGKIGGEEASAALRERVPEGAIESQLFDRAKMRLERSSTVIDDSDRVLLDVALVDPFTLAIVHRRGLSDIVAAQLGDLGPGLLDGFERRVLRNYTGDLGSLFRARSMLTPALVLTLERPPRDADWAEQIATSLCQPLVLQALERLTSTRPR